MKWSGTTKPDWPPAHLRPVRMHSNLTLWESFDWGRHPALTEAKPVIVDWYNGLPHSGALLIAGNVGTGKTHVADAIASIYGKMRIGYVQETEFFKNVQDSYNSSAVETERMIMNVLFQRDFIIFDDLGTFQTENLSWLENIYSLFFNRFLTVMQKPMLITTNLPLLSKSVEDLKDRLGTRNHSRLYEALGSERNYINLFDLEDKRAETFTGGKD